MTTLTVQAIYRNGALELPDKLDLPENAVVQVQIIPLKAGSLPMASLFGAFPELARLSSETPESIKALTQASLEKLSRLLDGLN